jgi:L-lysine exporter family protein LysE/ArgO
MLAAFIHGYILSVGLILPLGPQNAFVFTQGATQPRLLRALPVALVASLSDTTLILLAVLGVSVVVLTLAWIKTILVIIGVLFLTYVGWVTWRSNPDSGEQWSEATDWPLRRQVVFALSVSLLNPHAILDTIGVIGTSALSYSGDARAAFTLACVLNSWVWFLMLAVVGRLVGTFGRVRGMLNRASAVIMWVSAFYLVYNLLR